MRNDIQPIPDQEDPHLHAEYCPCQTCVRDRRYLRSMLAAVGRPIHYDEDAFNRWEEEEES